MAPLTYTIEDASLTYPGIPPFPNDVPTAPLVRLNYKSLQTSETERKAFFEASRDLGFFYLDLRGDEVGEQLLAESEQLFCVGEELFNEGAEELKKYDYSKGEREESGEENNGNDTGGQTGWKKGREPSYMGYKFMGRGVVDKAGNRDKNEFYNTPKDDLLNQSKNPFPHPKPLMNSKPIMASFTQHSHSLLTNLLGHLNTGLGLPSNTLEPYHDISLTSGDHIRMVHSPAATSSSLASYQNHPDTATLGAHTDFGSLTLLFNRLGGLQVLLPTSIPAENARKDTGERTGLGSWAYVRPLLGHAVVNLGDALVKFSGGILRSNIHRVATPPGEQRECGRLSLVYFMRPGDDVILKRLEGGIILKPKEGEEEEEVTAKKWIIDKAMAGTKSISERVKGRETNRQLVELQEQEGVARYA